MTTVLMIIFILSFMFLYLKNISFKHDKKVEFSLENSISLKGFWSIIVILVHIPIAYQNRIQDLIGSFAYIGVTFFFLTSSYGLFYSLDKKKDYLKNFFKNRVLILLIPCIIINIFNIILKIIFHENIVLLDLFKINTWVILLLVLYVIFYITSMVAEKKKIKNNKLIHISTIITIFVVIISLIDFFTKYKLTFIWPVEIYGFIYGMFVYILLEKKYTQKIFKNNYTLTTFLLATIVLGILYIKFKHIFFLGNYLLRILLGLFFNILLIILVNRISFSNKITIYLGNISYYIYLSHNMILNYVDKINIISNSDIYIITCVIITILIAAIVSKINNLIIKFIKERGIKNGR